jgi:hypothetical protein
VAASAGHVTSGPGGGNGGRRGFRSARGSTGAPWPAGPSCHLRQSEALRPSSIMGRADDGKPTHGHAVIQTRLRLRLCQRIHRSPIRPRRCPRPHRRLPRFESLSSGRRHYGESRARTTAAGHSFAACCCGRPGTTGANDQIDIAFPLPERVALNGDGPPALAQWICGPRLRERCAQSHTLSAGIECLAQGRCRSKALKRAVVRGGGGFPKRFPIGRPSLSSKRR